MVQYCFISHPCSCPPAKVEISHCYNKYTKKTMTVTTHHPKCPHKEAVEIYGDKCAVAVCHYLIGDLSDEEIEKFEQQKNSIEGSEECTLYKESSIDSFIKHDEHQKALSAGFWCGHYSKVIKKLKNLADWIRSRRPDVPESEADADKHDSRQANVNVNGVDPIVRTAYREDTAVAIVEGLNRWSTQDATKPAIEALVGTTVSAEKPPNEENGGWHNAKDTEAILNDILKLKQVQPLSKSALRVRREGAKTIMDEQSGYWHGKDTEGVFFRYKRRNESPEYFILYKKDTRFPREYPKLVDSASTLPPLEAIFLKNT